jgi:hypothetical protein
MTRFEFRRLILAPLSNKDSSSRLLRAFQQQSQGKKLKLFPAKRSETQRSDLL